MEAANRSPKDGQRSPIKAFLYQGQPAADIFYGVSSVDPVTMLAVFGVLIGSGAVATVIPAWCATRIDPVRVASNWSHGGAFSKPPACSDGDLEIAAP
jgi:hypothetical protein